MYKRSLHLLLQYLVLYNFSIYCFFVITCMVTELLFYPGKVTAINNFKNNLMRRSSIFESTSIKQNDPQSSCQAVTWKYNLLAARGVTKINLELKLKRVKCSSSNYFEPFIKYCHCSR